MGTREQGESREDKTGERLYLAGWQARRQTATLLLYILGWRLAQPPATCAAPHAPLATGLLLPLIIPCILLPLVVCAQLPGGGILPCLLLLLLIVVPCILLPLIVCVPLPGVGLLPCLLRGECRGISSIIGACTKGSGRRERVEGGGRQISSNCSQQWHQQRGRRQRLLQQVQ